MDRSLWLLLWLRGRSWFRLWGRSVRGLKGLLLALIGSLVFLPILVSAVLAPHLRTGFQITLIREYGPLVLLAYCVLNVLLSSGDRAVYYAPAEVNFLFSGPFRPRQMLLYKVVAGAGAAVVTALMMTFVLGHHASRFLSAYVGLFLSVQLLYLFSLTVGLAISTAGALAFSRGRKLLLLALAVLTVAAVWPLGRQALASPPRVMLALAARSPVVAAVVVPFRPFVMAFTADRVWPDLVAWSSLAVLVDLAFLVVVLSLNARFLEASAAASARVYDRLRRFRRGEVPAARAGFRLSPPNLPWMGGIGPNLWRQATTATRSPLRLAAMLLLYVVPVGLMVLLTRHETTGADLLGPSLTVFLGMSLVASTTVGYDFRPDLGRMEDLKTLPIRPTRLVLGQLLTPVLVLTVGQWLAMALIAYRAAAEPGWIAAAFALALPTNLLLAAIENLYFLWFPYRATGINSFDVQAMGRQLLLMTAKASTVGVAAALSGTAGFLTFRLTGGNLASAVGSAWVVALGCALALVPLVATAFDRFDVAGDRPE